MSRRKQFRKSSYTILAENVDEIVRQNRQASVLNYLLGLHPKAIRLQKPTHILDVACGTGLWVLEMAKANPHTQVIGFDSSLPIVEYACALAREQNILNAMFLHADAREVLRFQDTLFDLVHIRFCTGFMTSLTWPCFLNECHRITKPGGWCLNTELDLQFYDCPHASTFWKWYTDALYAAGQTFAPGGLAESFFPFQEALFAEAGFVDIRKHQVTINFSSGMPNHSRLMRIMYDGFYQVRDFLTRTGVARGEEVEENLRHLLTEAESSSFRCIGCWQHVWGRRANARKDEP
jgi:ubiquinone/menaquinone biosynthesis C-methylase UbiE